MPIKKERIKKQCKICGNDFFILPSRNHFTCCSVVCRNKAKATNAGGIYHRNAEKVEKVCETCNRNFVITEKRALAGKGKYCSKACKDKAHENFEILKCNHCGTEYRRVISAINETGNNFCSKSCANSFFFTGEKHWKWNGGRKTLKHGYVGILVKEHPFADDQGYYEEHRLVMEKHLGRFLNPQEVVHHINEIKDDNRLENLMLFPNNKKHMEHHAKLVTK